MISRCHYVATWLGWLFLLTACTMVDLPPVPPQRPYQPPILQGSSAHGGGKLTVAIPENRPPYFIGAFENGLERDVIRESFEAVGLHPEFMATGDRQKKFDSERFGIECVSSILEDFKLKSKAYFSDPVIPYQYTPFSLKKGGVEIRKFEDLAGKNVEAFSFASRYLGPEYANMIPRMLLYSEHLNRSSQVNLLLRGHVDVLVMDRIMFHSIRKNLINMRPTDLEEEIFESPISKTVDFKLACHHEENVKAFNKGLALLRAKPRYAELFKQYCELY
ncbi:putative ABC transporter substrate-binding protein [Gammaproteobacteria bacterium]